MQTDIHNGIEVEESRERHVPVTPNVRTNTVFAGTVHE
jgi:hypothetical protein